LNVAFIFLQVRRDVGIKQELKVRFGKKKKIKKKMDKIKFAIGMIISYSMKNTGIKNHKGVIIGWHYKYNWTFVKTFMKRFSFPYIHIFLRRY